MNHDNVLCLFAWKCSSKGLKRVINDLSHFTVGFLSTHMDA